MTKLIFFFLGLIAGVAIGFVIMALCYVSSWDREDDYFDDK